MRKKILEKRLARLMAKKNNLVARSQASTDVEEVKKINEELTELNDEIAETQEELEAEKEPTPAAPATEPTPAAPVDGQQRSFNPLAAYGVNQPEQRGNADPYGTMEYRNAFMAYVQRGVAMPENLNARAGGDEGVTLSTELGVIIPTTIMQEFIKEVSKVYGQVYAKVRKLNVKGGVQFPISDLKANFSWITETTVSAEQKAGDIDTYIEFKYHIGEIRVAQSLLAQVVTLDLFESEIVRIMTEAYVKTMDNVILAGTGKGQPLGITKDPRVTNVVTFTAAQFADWKEWRKRLFAKIPLSKRGEGEFLFTSATVESNLLTIHDGNDNPIFKEATELSIAEGADGGRFYGRNVTLVEPDVIKDFDDAASGDVVGIFWTPNDYAINTNYAFSMLRYFDQATNKWINKGLTIVDGKILDTSGCWIIKKA